MLKDLFVGVSRKYDALQNINDRSIPDKTEVNGLPIKYVKKVIEFVRHTNLDLEKIGEQFLAAVDSCTVAKDAERKMSSTKNVILDTFIDNYDDLFKKAAAAFEIPVGVFIGSPSKALKLKTEKCAYTKQDILYVKNNAKYLKELFDTSHALETPSIENRRTNTILAIALIATGIGSLAGIIRLIRAAFMPSKEDADKLNKFADYMHGYIKFVYTTLNVISTSITKEVGTECFGPFMDDMFGENEGSATESYETGSYSELKASIEAFSTDGDVAGTESIISKVAKFFKDHFNGISKKYNELQNINDSVLPEKIEVTGLPIEYVRTIVEFVKRTKLNLVEASDEMAAVLNSCSETEDGYRERTGSTNKKLEEFMKKYDKFFNEASKAFGITTGVIAGSPAKALQTKTKTCQYTKQDVLYIKNNMQYLKDVFDQCDATIDYTMSRDSARMYGVLMFLMGLSSGPGSAVFSLLGLIQYFHASGKPSKADTQRINRFVSTMRGYIKFIYKSLVLISDSVVSNSKGYENLEPYLDDMFGENEGDDKEDDKNATVVDNIAKESLSAKVYNIVATNIGYNRFIKQMHHHIASVETGKQVSALMDIVESYPKVLDSYRRMDFGISRKDNELIKKNAGIVMDILYSAGLHLLTSRKYFKDNNVLVLDIDSVNSDTMDTFNKNGGTMEDITRHVFHKYSVMNVTIPTNGLRVDEVINSKSVVAKEHMRRVDMSKKDMEIKHGGALVIAYNRVLGNYLSTVPSDKLPVGMSTHNFVKQNMRHVNNTSIYLKDSRLSVDECVYRFLLDLWYNDKPAYKQMYNKFEAKYKQLFNLSDGEITAEEKIQADAEVMADMAMNFVMDSLVCKHKA